MADVRLRAETVSNSGATIATFGANNYKTEAPFSKFSTRGLRFISITMGTAGDSDVDLTRASFAITGATSGEYTGTYTDADSYFSKALRSVQNYGEIQFVGIPSATAFVVAIADDTLNDGSAASPSVSDASYAKMEAEIKAAMGVGNKTPVGSAGFAYDGTVVVAGLTLTGTTFA